MKTMARLVKIHTEDNVAVAVSEIKKGDRKSTRLNSSHM